MYDGLNISVLEKGGYAVQVLNASLGCYNPFIVAFSSKTELLDWLQINLQSRSPDLVDRRAQAPAKPKLDDEIPF